VTEHQPRSAGGRPTVLAFDDLDVGPADTDGNRLDQHGPVANVGLGNVVEAGAPRLERFDGDGLHAGLSPVRLHFAALAPVTRILML
jgi:hypothetical protein